ncbi:MAG TPA: efflux RND transporter periplasmic adaptor subunit [Candidatus Marinimicrobia bacterium]|nr:efflux RND transporter periplasmic adaptor subunit [Candidatus Neomarinimicrobiota bacterium]HRS50899.1 efflux RND transporter periplasmic adaptor subunit [Candidatus Neomarinimicrobiota bacterium]HRU91759.1 efflux RND transporter periplasmic adaptor subunit [Candidatus Neomarinimicrobiota bacterium]
MKKKTVKKKIYLIIILVLAIVVGWRLVRKNGSDKQMQISYGQVSRGNIETIISSTGTLVAIGTVDVGTQVSGRIDKVLVDYNDIVKKDQVLAVLDTLLLSQSVKEAEANLQKMQALYEQAAFQYDRISNLFQRKLVSEQEYIDARTNKATSEVGLKQAQIALDKAVTDYGYAIIRSPISGTVIDRAVEEGQTVAASFSTPTLFTIAKDLTKMEIEALVDESDIGEIKTGQKVRFTVQSYQNKIFQGVVRQVRLQPQTVSNVVNYTVIVDADNHEQLLLPGMTATVDFIIDSRENVLIVPNSALKITPTEEMLAKAHQARTAQVEQLPDSVKIRLREQAPQLPSANQFPVGSKIPTRPMPIWYVNESGQILMALVQTGLSDTKNTEILENPEIKEGTKIIVSLITNGKKMVNNTSNNQRRGMGGPPPF